MEIKKTTKPQAVIFLSMGLFFIVANLNFILDRDFTSIIFSSMLMGCGFFCGYKMG